MKILKKLLPGIFAAVVMTALCAVCAGAVSFGSYGFFDYTVNDDNTVTITKYTGTETDVIIPSSISGKPVVEIGEYSMNYLYTMQTLEIPDTVTKISNSAFEGCSALTEINLPDSVRIIETCAFADCNLVTSVTIPASVEEIGKNAFNISGLTVFYVSGQNTAYTSKGGVLYTKDGTTIISFPRKRSTTEYSIPDTVTKISDYAFYDCENLNTVIIPDSVKSIGEYAFYASSITSIDIPDSVTTIGTNAFAFCEYAETIKLSSNLVSIPEYAFQYCYSVTELEIPSKVKQIGSNAFRYCIKLASLTFNEGLMVMGEAAFLYCRTLETAVIPSTVAIIGERAFGGCSEEFILTVYDGSYAEEYAKSNELNYRVVYKMTAPQVTATPGDCNVTLSWEAIQGADSYQVLCDINGTYTVVADNITETSAVIGDLINGTEYIFIVKVISEIGEEASSEPVEVTPVAPPVTVAEVEDFTIGGRASDALRLNWTKNETADGYIIKMYDGEKWVRVAKLADNETVTYRVEGLTPGTTYRFQIVAYKMTGTTTAVYSGYVTLTGTTNPGTVTGLKIGGRASDAIRLNWTKNESADGYIIEKYDGEKWVRVTKITSNETTTYRIAGLTPSTTYNFRIRTYNMVGKVALYSGYSNITGTTNPGVITGLVIGGKASDALRLNWDKNTSADGYIIEMYDGEKWVRITKITSNETLTYRKAGLESGTTYQFRIRGYNMVGSTALYGSYSYVDGTTN